jgi:pimeloyl-ACP methyl ester carboxylesterase
LSAPEVLAEGVLRTPDERFASLPGWPFAPQWWQPGGEHAAYRVHYVDEGPRDAPVTALCLHGNPSWSYLYRHMIPVFAAAGLRVVAPDLIGFGRSDKPAHEATHHFEWHRRMLLGFIEALDLRNVMLVCQDWGGIFGLTLPMAMPERFTRLVVMNTAIATGTLGEGFLQWRAYSNAQPDLPVGRLLARGKPDMTAAEAAAYDTPFPDASYKAALRAFPNLVPDSATAEGAHIGREALAFWRERWQGESFMAIGERDPVLGVPVMRALQRAIRGCPEPMLVPDGGHFVQEWGAPIARAALAHFKLD